MRTRRTPFWPESAVWLDRSFGVTLGCVLPGTSPAIERLLQDYRRRLNEHFGARIVELKLFGSHARGEARPDSDVDVAVVLDRILSHEERVFPMGLAGDLVVEHGLALTPIVLSVAELERLRACEDLLAENLDREGIAI